MAHTTKNEWRELLHEHRERTDRDDSVDQLEPLLSNTAGVVFNTMVEELKVDIERRKKSEGDSIYGSENQE
jgi:hypothetical protein